MLLSGAPAGVTGDAPPAHVTSFVHVTIVPMDREVLLEDQTVVIANGRIREIGQSERIKTPDKSVVIDGHGKYLMPGLADMHTHTWDENDFTLLIANGVTTIRNMFGDPMQLEWRRRIEAGDLVGPTIYTAGPIIDGNPPIWPGSAVVETAERAREVVAEQHKAGYDFLKVYSGLSKEAYDAVLEAAKKIRMPVVGHTPIPVGLAHVLHSGIRSIEHLTGYETALVKEQADTPDQSRWTRVDETRFAAIAGETAKAGVWNCPTFTVYQNRATPGEPEFVQKMLDRPEMRYVSPETVQSWRPENNFIKSFSPARIVSQRQSDPTRKKFVKALYDAGARLLLGTDYPNPFVVPGFSIQAELRNFVEAGLSPYEAIRAGTSGAAEFLGAGKEFGTVAVGRRADLILVEGNPLKDVANVSRRAGVMIRGKWLPQADLTAMLEKLAAAYDTKRKTVQEGG